jgi:hypothetical protein
VPGQQDTANFSVGLNLLKHNSQLTPHGTAHGVEAFGVTQGDVRHPVVKAVDNASGHGSCRAADGFRNASK